jgi:hypothetical protein
MGRKSNTKKNVRKIVKEQQKTQTKKELKNKSKKDLKDEARKIAKTKKKTPAKKTASKQPKPPKTPPKKVNKKKIFGWVLVLIMLGAVTFLGYFLFTKALSPAPIAKMLPAKNTIMTLELNTNINHHQLNKALKLLEGHSGYSEDGLKDYLENKFLVNFDEDLSPWIGRNIGFAFLNSDKEFGAIYKVYFAEVFDKAPAKKYFGKNVHSEYRDYQIYALDLPAFAVFIDNYVFLTRKEESIHELIDAKEDDLKKLSENTEYNKIQSNLPLNKMGYIYLDFQNIQNGFFQFFPYLSEKGLSMETFAPFFKLFKAEGFALIAEDENFLLESFLTMKGRNNLDESLSISSKKYEADLAQYIPQDIKVFYGAYNLEEQIRNMVDLVMEGEMQGFTLFEKIADNYTKKYFGTEKSFMHNLLPLFEKEFAFVFEENELYKVLIDLGKKDINKEHVHELAEAFMANGGVSKAEVVEHVLEDGTRSKEIIAVPKPILKTEESYQKETIYLLETEEGDFGMYYSVFDNIAVISNKIDGVKTTLDLNQDESNSFEPALTHSNEIYYLNLRSQFPEIFGETPLKSISLSKEYSSDGIKTLNYLQIE